MTRLYVIIIIYTINRRYRRKGPRIKSIAHARTSTTLTQPTNDGINVESDVESQDPSAMPQTPRAYQARSIICSDSNYALLGSDGDIDDDEAYTCEMDNTMMDLYRQWYLDLRAEFEFRDTVGDLRFLTHIFESMLETNVIVIVYHLSVTENPKMNESLKFINEIDRRMDEMFNKYNIHNESMWSKFDCVLIGLATEQPGNESRWLQDHLSNKHEQVRKKFGDRWNHFSVRSDCFVFLPTTTQLSHEDLENILGTILSATEPSIQENEQNARNRQKKCFNCCNYYNRNVNIQISRAESLKLKLKIDPKNDPFLLRSIPNTDDARSINFTLGGSLLDNYKYSNGFNNEMTGLVATVHHWKLKRRFDIVFKRLMFLIVAGLFFPFLIAFQTCVFLCYSAKWGLKTNIFPKFLINYFSINKYGVLLFDFLSPIFRRPTLDPSIEQSVSAGLRSLLTPKFIKKDNEIEFTIDWFFRQNEGQKIGRALLSLFCVGYATLAAYNLLYYVQYGHSNGNQVCFFVLY